MGLNEEILKENDYAKCHKLRGGSLVTDYFLASVDAVSRAGFLVAYDKTGSRVEAFSTHQRG